MWRNHACSIFSSRTLLSSSANPKCISYPYSVHSKAIIQPVFSQSHSSCSSSPPPSSPLIAPSQSTSNLQIASNGSDGIRAFASLAHGVPFKVRDAVEFGRHYGQCYWELSKARLSMLVVATSGTGFILGSGNAVDFAGLCWTCAGTMMVAASANSLNQVFEITNDAKMKRTMQRPLPSGRIRVPHAVTWASCVGASGTAMLAYKTNMLAAGLAASNLILYAFVYTPLKQIHPVNTWVGAVVGAIPPLLGWAAASGQVSVNGMILPAALYFWQIPHFMALAYLCRTDYAAGGYKMFSLMDPSGQRTAAVALRNCLYLVPLGFLCYDWGMTSGWFCIESTALTLAITAAAFSFYRDRTTKKARKMFHASLLYLPVFMSGLLFHRLSDDQQLNAEMGSDRTVAMKEGDNIKEENSGKRPRISSQTRAPVAYASVAPFPFLPAPSYANP